MLRRVGLRALGNGYILTLTPTQFEMIRRVLVHLHGGGYSARMVALATGEASPDLLALRNREVDFRSPERIEIEVSDADLHVLLGSLTFTFLNRSSEEAFHQRIGFYSENVQVVAQAICGAVESLGIRDPEPPVGDDGSPRTGG